MKKAGSSLLRSTMIGCLALAGTVSGSAWATEGGNSHYSLGLNTIRDGVVPGEGDYFYNYNVFYEASHTTDSNGNNVKIPNFGTHVTVDAAKFLHVWDFQLLGANVGSYVALPFYNIDIKTPRFHTTETNFGDAAFAPLTLGWREGPMAYYFEFASYLPTGDYSKTNKVNAGQNTVTNSFQLGTTWFIDDKSEIDLRGWYGYNYTDPATHYQSGQETNLDWGAYREVADHFLIGATGYFYEQLTDDTKNGIRYLNGNKGQVFAAGPSLLYTYRGGGISAKWQHEFDAQNRTEGDRYWIQFSLTL